VLHPEVRLALLTELVRSGHNDEALREAAEFERLCPRDGRLADVRKLAAELTR
jgi:hypothetical protein